MTLRQYSLALLLLPFVAQMAAAETPDAQQRLAGIAPFLNAQTMAVVRLDLKRVDLKGGFDRVEKQWAIPAEQAMGVRDILKTVEFFRMQLVNAGASEIYVIASAGPDATPPPTFVVLPVTPGKDPKAVVEITKGLPRIEAEPFVMQGAVVLAPPDSAATGATDFVKGIKPIKRPEFEAALAAAGNTDLQVLFVPNADLLAEGKTKIPGVLEAAGDLPESLKWLAVSLNLPPTAAFALVTNMKDEASTSKALARLNGLLANEKVAELRKDPVTDKAIEALIPKQQGTQLRMVLNDSNGGIQAVADGIKANLGKIIQAVQQGGVPGLGQ